MNPNELKNVYCPNNGLYILYVFNDIQIYYGIYFISFTGRRTSIHNLYEYPGITIKSSSTTNNFSLQAGGQHLNCKLYKLNITTPMNNIELT